MIAILGITLKQFERLKAKGENVKANKWIEILLKRQSQKKFKTRSISEMPFYDFVDCERYLENENFVDFCRIFVKRKWFETIYIHNCKLIIEDYASQKAKLIEENDFIFNPPQYGEIRSETVGDEIRKEFVKRFGNYVVLTDVVCLGDITKYKKVEQWKVSEFFFWANYLKGQRIVENVK